MQQIGQLYELFYSELEQHFGSGEARSISRIVFEDVLNWLPGRLSRSVEVGEWQQVENVKQRLLAGEPLQYILGTADFYGHRFFVNENVLIPRPETEELVEWVVETMTAWPERLRLLDIGTGSGCIAISAKKELPAAEVCGCDISQEALSLAQRNAHELQAKVLWRQFDILEASTYPTLPSYSVIVSNPPYIPPSERELMPKQVLDHEPELALFVPEEDSLLFYRTIMRFAQSQLSEEGWLFFECNEYNAEKVADLGVAMGFVEGEIRKDLQGKDRMWRGQWTVATSTNNPASR